jgi:hypothetical protein
MPSRIAPGTRHSVSVAIATKPMIATIAAAESSAPILTGAPAMPRVTMPASFSPMKARNSPMPAAKLKRRPGGSASLIHCRTRAAVSSVNSTPATNTAPSAVCQRQPSTRTTV